MTDRPAGDRDRLPEFTRGLRAFASPAALRQPEMHERFFSPLIRARRVAEGAPDWSARLDAFDAERIEATVRALLATFAHDTYPASPPDQRGLGAQMEDACGELFDALESLLRAANRCRDANDDATRDAAWMQWVDTLASVFGAADRSYERVAELLAGATAAIAAGRRRERRADRKVPR